MFLLANTLLNFFEMGGYAAFVWPAYLAMLLTFILFLYLPVRKHRQLKAKLRSKR